MSQFLWKLQQSGNNGPTFWSQHNQIGAEGAPRFESFMSPLADCSPYHSLLSMAPGLGWALTIKLVLTCAYVFSSRNNRANGA